MAKSPKSFLLEQLRAQADAVAAKRMQRLKLSREVVDRIDQRMHHVFQYFDEACKLLQVISPPVERSFELPHIVRYAIASNRWCWISKRRRWIRRRSTIS